MRDAPRAALEIIGRAARPVPNRETRRRLLRQHGMLGAKDYDVRRTRAAARGRARE